MSLLSVVVGCFAEIALFEQVILQRLQIICYKRRLMDVGYVENLKIAIRRPGFRILPEAILFTLVASSMFKLTGRMRKKCEGLR
jgi:hypothetical protein